MTFVSLFLGLLQCLLLWALRRTGIKLSNEAHKDHEKAKNLSTKDWPGCALFIPVSGRNPAMAEALRSMLEQDYPDYYVYFIIAQIDDPAHELLDLFCREYNHARLVVSGLAIGCGQKNYNLLAGISEANDETEIFAFCDSTHIAQPDFLRCLLYPIVAKKAKFSTGYHQVQPRDRKIITLAYTLCVLFMRFLQGMSSLTQLWGGAMAMTRKAFSDYRVADIWKSNVVDDCSLSAWLYKQKVKIELCPGALLTTWSANHQQHIWRAWLERQILFLKFCMPGQWIGLICVSLFLIIPSLWCIWAILMGMFGDIGGMVPFLALCWLCLLGWIIDDWREFIILMVSPAPWIAAFFCASFMFAFTSFTTLFKKHILWNKIRYEVGNNGVVIKIQKQVKVFDTKLTTK